VIYATHTTLFTNEWQLQDMPTYLSKMTRSDVTLYSWNSPAPSARNARFYLSRFVATKQSGPKPGWLPKRTRY